MCCDFPICLAGAENRSEEHSAEPGGLRPKDADAVVVDCATCGAALKKEYADILEEMGEDAEAARELGEKCWISPNIFQA